ncbi:hypothetical protein RHSIM_Rhsim11G0073600 [Rhododendron simsii]|uniref:Uncharacterized protein n=1 Tax=Rhododendron simsii TaxID=118357 RepID=A0A834LAJ6_RHOSS|nr:hypothetical protein RHSIM_Rhsim11G0073600 [Rhododendron simsii]
MEAKQGEKVVGAKGGGATEAVVANPIAGEARTKPAATSLVPPQRKLVKKMMGDATVKAVASCFCSTDQQKDKTHSAPNPPPFGLIGLKIDRSTILRLPQTDECLS